MYLLFKAPLVFKILTLPKFHFSVIEHQRAGTSSLTSLADTHIKGNERHPSTNEEPMSTNFYAIQNISLPKIPP